MRIAAIVLVLAAGCSSLPPFDAGTCGNLVLDPGESCDEDSEQCVQCALQCGSHLPGEACEGSFVCGIDGVCHAPGGGFGRVTSMLGLTPVAMTVTDIDRDNIGDVVAVSGTSVTVAFGASSGDLQNQSRTIAPSFRGTPAFGNLDADGRTDILLPTADGIVGYSSQHGVIAPHPFAIDLGLTTLPSCAFGQSFGVFSIDEQYLGVMYVANQHIGMAVIDSSGHVACPQQLEVLCPIPQGSNPLLFVADLYDTTSPSALGVTTASRVLAISTPGGACTASIARTSSGLPFAFSPQLLPSFVGRPVLADLVGNGCPSLIQSTGGATLTEYQGIGSAGSCSFANAPTSIVLGGPTIPADATAIGHARLEPPLAGYRRDALALTTGVYAVANSRTQAQELYRSDRALYAVEAVDLDGDGDLDIAAMTFNVDGLDALYRTPSMSGTTFLRIRVPTRGIVTHLATGDFDGNQAGDIAYTEEVTDGDRLSVVFGTRDRLLEPLEVGAFTRVVGLVPLQATDSSDPQRVVEDLVIIDLPDTQKPPFFTLLHGSAQRTMLSFYDPRNRVFGETPLSQFTGVAFANGNRATPLFDDVLAIETPIGKMWPVGNLETGLAYPTATLVPAFRDCAIPGTGGFCTETARYVAWPLADRDLVIGVTDPGPGRVVTLDSRMLGGIYNPIQSTALDDVPAALVLSSLYAVDFAGDGTHTLVAAYGPRMAGTDGGALELCDVDPSGIPTRCQDPTAAGGTLEGWTCVDAVPAAVAPSGRLDPTSLGAQLVAACHRGGEGALFRVFVEGGEVISSRITVDPSVTSVLRNVVHVAAGDVTGDGVVDLLATTAVASDPIRTVLVIPQCEASDLACLGVVP